MRSECFLAILPHAEGYAHHYARLLKFRLDLLLVICDDVQRDRARRAASALRPHTVAFRDLGVCRLENDADSVSAGQRLVEAFRVSPFDHGFLESLT